MSTWVWENSPCGFYPLTPTTVILPNKWNVALRYSSDPIWGYNISHLCTLQWRHVEIESIKTTSMEDVSTRVPEKIKNIWEGDGVSNHQPHDCLLNRLFRRRSKKTSKLRVTDLCAGNLPVTGEFPAQRARNADFFFSIWRRHHDKLLCRVSCVINLNLRYH